ncbi:hypothetical protein [Nocardia sp. BMG111209]|uniref:hypothetical protein n=1 Tax=Nocardia sp. BMG111209 TaxID=1160137 RepID=UPI00039DF804|nr:hypothetical protein [Nocardia sp. BMG111209]
MVQPPTYEGPRAARRLAELGLSVEMLETVFERAEADVRMCTKHDPPTMPGFTRWARIVRFLREELESDGWTYDNPANQPRTIHPRKLLAIVVKSGDEVTGFDMPGLWPANRNPIGEATRRAVDDNGQFALFTAEDLPGLSKTPMWVLLYQIIDGVVQAELSLPDKIEGDRIGHWLERIILPAIDLGPDHIGRVGPSRDDGGDTDAYTVEVERKEG